MPLCNHPKSNGKLQITIFISSPENISTYYILACHTALHEVFTTYEVRGNSKKRKEANCPMQELKNFIYEFPDGEGHWIKPKSEPGRGDMESPF